MLVRKRDLYACLERGFFENYGKTDTGSAEVMPRIRNSASAVDSLAVVVPLSGGGGDRWLSRLPVSVLALLVCLGLGSTFSRGVAQSDVDAASSEAGEASKGDASKEEPAAGDVAPLSEAGMGLAIDAVKLGGRDAKLGDREAFRLLEIIANGDRPKRLAHLSFLRALLAPRNLRLDLSPHAPPKLQDPDRFRAAQRVLEALAIGTGEAGPPFEGVDTLLQPLVGYGPSSLRDATVVVLRALLQWESIGRRSSTAAESVESLLEKLGDRVRHNRPPPPTVLADLSRILWEVEPKYFLGAAIGGMELNRASHPDALPLYERELRSRIGLELSGVDAWQTWWEAHRDKSFAEIVVDVERQRIQQAVEVWRRGLKRLREAANPDLVLAEIQSVLSSSSSDELRLAAVSATGDFADWLRGSDWVTARDGRALTPAEVDSRRATLLAESCTGLVLVAEGGGRSVESGRLVRGALTALRKYQLFLSRGSTAPEGDDLQGRVERLVLSRLSEIEMGREPVADNGEWRERRDLLLEVILLAGALQIESSEGSLISVLSNEDLGRDEDLVAASLQSLGRLSKKGVSEQTVDLILRHFERAAGFEDEARQKIQARCVTALNAKPDRAAAGEKQRGLFWSILGKPDQKGLHTHAIVGLGTLAQAADPRAVDHLAAVVDGRGRYEATEVIAAIDAIAYVDERRALEIFAPHLRARVSVEGSVDPVEVHLRRKVENLLREGGSVERGLELVAQLTDRALTSDDPTYLSYLVELFDGPALEGGVLTRGQAPAADDTAIEGRWRLTLAQILCRSIVSPGGERSESVSKLVDLAKRVPHMVEPGERAEELRQLVELDRRLSALEGALLVSEEAAKGESDLLVLVAGVSQGMRALTVPLVLSGVGDEGDLLPEARWSAWLAWGALRAIERVLASAPESARGRAREFVARWEMHLADGGDLELQKQLAEGVREASARRLKAALESPAPAESSGPPDPSPATPRP